MTIASPIGGALHCALFRATCPSRAPHGPRPWPAPRLVVAPPPSSGGSLLAGVAPGGAGTVDPLRLAAPTDPATGRGPTGRPATVDRGQIVDIAGDSARADARPAPPTGGCIASTRVYQGDPTFLWTDLHPRRVAIPDTRSAAPGPRRVRTHPRSHRHRFHLGSDLTWWARSATSSAKSERASESIRPLAGRDGLRVRPVMCRARLNPARATATCRAPTASRPGRRTRS